MKCTVHAVRYRDKSFLAAVSLTGCDLTCLILSFYSNKGGDDEFQDDYFRSSLKSHAENSPNVRPLVMCKSNIPDSVVRGKTVSKAAGLKRAVRRDRKCDCYSN